MCGKNQFDFEIKCFNKIVFTVAVKNELQAEALNSTFILYKNTILSTANIIVTGISKYKANSKISYFLKCNS